MDPQTWFVCARDFSVTRSHCSPLTARGSESYSAHLRDVAAGAVDDDKSASTIARGEATSQRLQPQCRRCAR